MAELVGADRVHELWLAFYPVLFARTKKTKMESNKRKIILYSTANVLALADTQRMQL